jgi:hypothetical protein
MEKLILNFKKLILKTTRFSGYFLKYFLEKKNIAIYSSLKNHVFFGYYDKSPFDCNDKYLLAGHLPIGNYCFDNSEQLELGFYELGTNNFHSIDKTQAWSWQLGARFYWHPTDNTILTYNKLINGKYKNIFFNFEQNKIIHLLDQPSYDLSHDGKISLSLNFERLQLLRPGYGYTEQGHSRIEYKIPKEEGIIITDVLSNKSEIIVSLLEVSKLNPTSDMKHAFHYFNHISISPLSTGFIFLHLWVNKDKRSSRFFYYDLINNKIQQITEENPVSHYAWQNENKLLVTEVANKRYYYNLYNLQTKTKICIAEDELKRDGHPSILRDQQRFIYDTYPDKFGYQSLNLFDMTTNTNKILFKTYMPNKFTGEFKCDLHPRLSRDDKMISIDLVHNNKRAMGIIKI